MTSSFDSKDLGNCKIFIDSTLNTVNDKIFIAAPSTNASNYNWYTYSGSIGTININPLPPENPARKRNKEKVITILKGLGYTVVSVEVSPFGTFMVTKPHRKHSVQMSFDALKEELLSIETYVEFMLEEEK